MSRATDQEIIFESNDFEEDPNATSSFVNRSEVTNNENILSSSLNPLEAFQYFQKFVVPVEGKHYYQLNPNTPNRSHIIESPWEKYYRLKTELEDLKTDLNSIEIVQSEKKDTIWSVLQEKTQSLLDESSNLSNHSAWRYVPSSSSSGVASIDLKSDLLQEILKSFSASSTGSSKEGGELESKQVEMVKSIYHSVSSSFSQRLLTLEKKITSLETILGMEGNDSILSQSFSSSVSSSSSSSSFPILSTISRLEQKVSLLDSVNYDSYRSKISFLKVELESLSSHLSSSSDPKSSNSSGGEGGNLMGIYHKIEGFLEQYSVVETMITEIPQLILRLKTLENIHWNANQFVGRLGSLEQEILQINKDLQSNSIVLQELKGSLVESFTSMKENIEQMENKIKKY
jgi:hypothetical protein